MKNYNRFNRKESLFNNSTTFLLNIFYFFEIRNIPVYI